MTLENRPFRQRTPAQEIVDADYWNNETSYGTREDDGGISPFTNQSSLDEMEARALRRVKLNPQEEE